jgi:hypothetical protein
LLREALVPQAQQITSNLYTGSAALEQAGVPTH